MTTKDAALLIGSQDAKLPRRALVIAPQPFFSPRGTPLSVYYRTLITAEQGVEVDLLTYGEGQDVEIGGVNIIRIPHLPFLGAVKTGPSYLKMFLDLFLIAWSIVLLTIRRYDFVHAHEEAVFFCLMLKPIFRFRLVYDMHSSLPQNLVNFKFTKSKIILNVFDRLEQAALRKSEGVITICPDLADYALGRMPNTNNHFLIENSIFDPVRLKSASTQTDNDSQTFKALGIPDDRKIIIYAGTLEPYQGIDLLLESFDEVRRRRDDIFLLIVGGQPEQVALYRDLAEKLDLTRDCLLTGRLPQKQARALCAAADVQVSPRISGTNTPLKVYEQLASGVPLVATRVYSHTQVLNDDVALLVEPEKTAMAKGLLDALSDESTTTQRVEAAKQLYAERYAREVYVSKMKKLLQRLV